MYKMVFLVCLPWWLKNSLLPEFSHTAYIGRNQQFQSHGVQSLKGLHGIFNLLFMKKFSVFSCHKAKEKNIWILLQTLSKIWQKFKLFATFGQREPKLHKHYLITFSSQWLCKTSQGYSSPFCSLIWYQCYGKANPITGKRRVLALVRIYLTTARCLVWCCVHTCYLLTMDKHVFVWCLNTNPIFEE